MNERRNYPRFDCKQKVKFLYYEGDPDTIDIETSKGIKCKGTILDISKGGIFIASDSMVSVNLPVHVSFTNKRSKFTKIGHIVRTGLLKNNPADIVQKFKNLKIKKKAYLAIEFENVIENLNVDDIRAE